MDFGAEIADRSYQEIPTGALRPRNDILGSAVRLNDKLKFELLGRYFYGSWNESGGAVRRRL